MEKRTITALAENLGRHVELSKSRLETLGMLMLGMISARTVNLANVAPERGAMGVAIASTYRRFQRFFQHVRLPADWAAPMIAGLADCGSGRRGGKAHLGAGSDQLEDRGQGRQHSGSGGGDTALSGTLDVDRAGPAREFRCPRTHRPDRSLHRDLRQGQYRNAAGGS